MKLEEVDEAGSGVYMFFCPGCKSHHEVTTKTKNKYGAQWGFNGDVNNPTFTPSLHVWREVDGQRQTLCHSFVTNGMIQFLGDSIHELKNTTVELLEIEK